ncbi:DUF262 domain-containing protein [Compostimonas suwonensis]|uniref:Uncharacterized protein DUF262 n=1 Tax=Compostimonas suwonensis TaxID=1048394 RepID=A0A2M9BTW7_9MICO|nr:DUF262 domain-containing protein [Compostimonas suwonensis]PJJ61385.1 uncharacterized protein DUF262 [Compostimonas suwonensis]
MIENEPEAETGISSTLIEELDFTQDEIDEQQEVDPTPGRVAYTSTDFDVEGLVRRLGRNDIVIPTFGEESPDDVQIETARFQRPSVWTKVQMDRFIESLLLGYPIPGIFLVQQRDKRYLVLDGQQRLRTLAAFYEGIAHKKEFSLQHVGSEFKGLTYKKLSGEQRRSLDSTFIQATIVQTDASQTSLDAVYQVFERLNTGGTQLTPHEIRIALYAGPMMDWLTLLNNVTSWRGLYGPPARHLRDQELILRIVALVVSPGTYKRPLKKFLNDFLSAHRTMTDISPDDLEERFTKAADLLLSGPGAGVLRPGGNAVNAALTEALFVGLMRALEIRDFSPKEIADASSRLALSPDLSNATQRATADEESVRRRLAIVTEAFLG